MWGDGGPKQRKTSTQCLFWWWFWIRSSKKGVVIWNIKWDQGNMQTDRCSFHITQNMKIPPGLLRQLRESFQCYICRSTIVPPVIFARCYKRTIGGQTCIDQWYQGAEGSSQSCPICKFERAFTETTVLRGFDDFLQAITPLVRNCDMPQPEDHEQDSSDWVKTWMVCTVLSKYGILHSYYHL